METLKEMQERHRLEYEELRAGCQHYNVEVYDKFVGFRHRQITIQCQDCGLPLVGFSCEGAEGRVEYARGFKRVEEG